MRVTLCDFHFPDERNAIGDRRRTRTAYARDALPDVQRMPNDQKSFGRCLDARRHDRSQLKSCEYQHASNRELMLLENCCLVRGTCPISNFVLYGISRRGRPSRITRSTGSRYPVRTEPNETVPSRVIDRPSKRKRYAWRTVRGPRQIFDDTSRITNNEPFRVERMVGENVFRTESSSSCQKRKRTCREKRL